MRKSTFQLNRSLYSLFNRSQRLTNGPGWITGSYWATKHLYSVYVEGTYGDEEFDTDVPEHYEYQIKVPFSFMKFRLR